MKKKNEKESYLGLVPLTYTFYTEVVSFYGYIHNMHNVVSYLNRKKNMVKNVIFLQVRFVEIVTLYLLMIVVRLFTNQRLPSKISC